MCDVIVYHPLLDSHGDLEVPTIGEFVWFSQNQQPYLGQVVSVDPTVSRPIVVQLFRPQAMQKAYLAQDSNVHWTPNQGNRYYIISPSRRSSCSSRLLPRVVTCLQLIVDDF